MKKIDFSKARFLSCTDSPKGFPPTNLPEIAFLGRSNVGKSSLINTLTRQKKLAKISGTPGKTRLAVFFDVEERLRFVDFPGYGYAKVKVQMREVWDQLMEQYFSSRKNLKAVVLIMDIRHAPTDLDLQLLQWLSQFNFPVVPVLNKSDKLSNNQKLKRLNEIRYELRLQPDELAIPFSAVKRTGLKELEEVLIELARARTKGESPDEE